MWKIIKKYNEKFLYIKKLKIFYYYNIFNNKIYSITDQYNNNLYISKPLRQIYITIYSKKMHTYSAGLIAKYINITLKFYKKTKKVNTNIILFLQNILENKASNFYYVTFKNFTFSIWNFLEKLWTLTSCQIFFLFHKQSYNSYKRPVKRLKKKIVKLLKKS